LAGSVEERFRRFLDDLYPADGIVVYAGGGPMSPGGKRNLKIEDAEAIAAATGIGDWDPLVFAGPRDVRVLGETQPAGLVGMSERAERVRRRSVFEGEFLSAAEVRNRARVALIGRTTAERLFPNGDPIGKELFVDNVGFEVKGVLEPRGADPHGGDQDNVVVVPYTTLLEAIVRKTAISGATFRLADRDRVEATAEEIRQLVRERHRIGPGQTDDFSVFTATSMNAMFRRTFRTFELFIPLIAGTLFLIAALVILSLQQLAVKARAREIGLRRAVGASVGDVERQFVLEIGLVAAGAALAGLALAQIGFVFLAPMLAKKFGIVGANADPIVVLIAIAAALVTGLLGALLPARKAARLDPVAALRS
ncbi:MAG: ABC transporter permease, partial [Myxococcota bacterium]